MSTYDQATRPSKMSNDRIHFSIPARNLIKKSYIALLSECFGIQKGEFGECEDLKVICRPSQFARFVVLRHTKYAESNSMSDLNMKLVTPAAVKPQNLIDCSMKPNTAVGVAA